MLDWLAYTLVRAISGALCRLPPAVAVWLGRQVGWLACGLRPDRARVGIQNLRAAFDGALAPGEPRRIIRACYQQLGAGIVELLRLPVIDRAYIDRYVTIEGQEHFDAARGSGRPLMLLTGHYGNWELSSIVAALKGFPITALARSQNRFPRLYRLLMSFRESKGCVIVHKGGAVKRLIASLARGQLIGIVGDQASRQGIWVEWFGRPALFATGPFKLAYEREAVILPVFTHRVRGPFHRIVIEPPIRLSRDVPETAAIRGGIEQFAEALARHIREQPEQWLWMHKRWKRTPARRVLVLSDGKIGHLKQSLAVVEALRDHRPETVSQVIDVRYRRPLGRLFALLWSWWGPAGWGGSRCLALALTPAAASALLTRYADLIVSCGSSSAPVNLLWARAQRAKSVVLMNPAPLPARRFDLVIAPRHDALPPRPNTVQTIGAVAARWRDETIGQAVQALERHPRYLIAAPEGPRGRPGADRARPPTIAVFLGGETARYALTAAFADAVTAQVKAACEAVGGWCLVTTSRRTAPEVERLLAGRLGSYPQCRFLLLASRDSIDGTMEGMLGSSDVAVVTGESISMVSEACASGRPVVVVELPLRGPARSAPTKHRRFLQGLVAGGYARLVPVPEVSLAIQRALKEPRPAKRLDNFAVVRDAVASLL